MCGALEGIRVLDLSRVLAGPYCTMILGDLGAEVIKVEGPGGSDDTRQWGPPYTGGESAYYLCANRNKRAITLNLKTDEGKDVLKRLIKKSDVIIENFKNGTMDKWGLGYDQLKEINPQIVHCSITGFGRTGPYNGLPGYDFVIQAMSGLMSITGSEESGPMKVGVAISDIFSGLYAAIGIQAALMERDRSGKGQSVDISLFDSQISALANVASNYLVSGKVPDRLGNEHPNIVPYQPFPTADGQMAVAVGNDGQFQKFLDVLGLSELKNDERFTTNSNRLENRRDLETFISEKMKTRTSDDWLAQLQEQGIPAGPINTVKEMFEDPQVKARNLVKEVAHPTAGKVNLVGSPVRLSRTPAEVTRHPPLAGEHTEEVLTEAGYSEDDISSMRAEKII
ncbi:CoA transferase [Salipaludibacillus sp. CUR1]|uniref:CaiB/BaiF CoA transferase family protein n=1 Tax=Salipaludibacillus sp. CUR1 TaxID=2820003 RepID=UPI001E28B568|nr:CaiB/BaiF CoA-transferase family protein [Salipaludibacillus sp. CUR1]MCE7791803.1 CoA transferase [Salipaludibacillus sp. CUR1]